MSGIAFAAPFRPSFAPPFRGPDHFAILDYQHLLLVAQGFRAAAFEFSTRIGRALKQAIPTPAAMHKPIWVRSALTEAQTAPAPAASGAKARAKRSAGEAAVFAFSQFKRAMRWVFIPAINGHSGGRVSVLMNDYGNPVKDPRLSPG